MKRLHIITLFAMLILLGGCGMFPSNHSELKVKVDSSSQTNNGNPFYAVIRSVDQADFLTEGYQSIAGKVFQQPADTTILTSKIIIPGKDQKFTVKSTSKKPVAIYFLFTDPGANWKAIVDQPFPSSLTLNLDGNEIVKKA